ncbi:formylglycine-generating enzyme family protein [Myxococcota bacterium]|nr:formylglycine-generating enzyme family protein [Myxococcota bacterium]
MAPPARHLAPWLLTAAWLLLGGCNPSGSAVDDDAAADDDAAGDDDVTGDDDATGDDDVTADDDATGDDDVTADDDTGDDDAIIPDDDSGGDVSESFVAVAPGTFTMGAPEFELGRDSDEVQHEVTLTRGFDLQATEVTQGQWEARMGNNPSQYDDCGDDCPVEHVNWWEAAAYANEVSAAEGLAKCYVLDGCGDRLPGEDMECDSVTVNAPGGDPTLCEGYRLPTESEWEYAYRAGTTTPIYNGELTYAACGVDPLLDLSAWYCGNAGGMVHRVAQKIPNAWGLYDMAGGMWEWCGDWYGEYPESSTDPTGPATGTSRMMRGGSWISDAHQARAAERAGSHPEYTHYSIGFRLARSWP